MTQILINEADLLHTLLCEETQKNISRIQEIQTFSDSLTTFLTTFINSLNTTSRFMFKKLKVDEEEDHAIIFLSKYAVDLLNQLSKKVTLIVKKVKNQVADPLEHFYESQKSSYEQLRAKSGDLFSQLEGNSSFLNEINKNFCQNRTKDLTEQELSDYKLIYELQSQKCNEKWLEIKYNYKKLLAEADSTNSFRCNFTLKMQVKMCKLINRLVNSQNVDESLVGYEEISDETQKFSIGIKQRIRDNLGKSLLLEQKSMEEFDGSHQFAYTQKVLIDDFITIFTGFTNFKEDESKHQKARTLILSNVHWSTYFLNKLRANLHTEIKLSSIKYHEITTIIKYLFANSAEQDKNEQIIYNIMYISYRMSYNGNYIIKELGKYQSFWQCNDRWYRIVEYLRDSKDEVWISKKIIKNEKIRQAVKVGWNWLSHNQKIVMQKRNKNQKMINDAKAYDILCQINYFMSRLEIHQKFIFDFIVEASNRYGLANENKHKLLKIHYFNKQNCNSKTNPTYLKRKKKLQEKFKALTPQDKICTCIGKSLSFLPANQSLLELRLVSKLWATKLKNKISKRFLIQQKNEDYLNKIRLKVYIGYCPNILTKNIFQKMVAELPKVTQHSEIISLDAKRSLAWDQSLRENLVIVLKCFAFYHPNVGYLQGMNYLCENLLKITDEKFIVYKMFEYLMNNPFYGMYSANFDGLKTKIYQFMRIVQREKPKLYDHFETEKLEGEHFVLPWAITLWGEMSGDLCWLLWDGFIAKGWKWWFKTLLWMLNILEPELISMNFEEMMKCFSQLSTGLLNMNIRELKDFGIDIVKAKSDIDKIPLHDDLIKDLEKQYKVRVEMVDEYLKKLNIKANKKGK